MWPVNNNKKTERALKKNEQIKRKIYKCITCHPQVVQSPIYNDCLKVIFDDQIEPQMVPKLLPQVSVREFHNSHVSYTNDVGIKEARDEENNTIISDSALRTLFTPK